MKLSKTILITAILATTPVLAASASDGTIEFTGKIIASTCKVDGNDKPQTQTVDLGSVNSSAFSNTGSYAGAKAFKISLSGCESTTKSATISFDGTRDTTNLNLLALNDVGTPGVADGVAIGIYESNSTDIIPMMQSSNEVDLSSGAGTFNFVAKYVSTKATVTAGSANGSATFTISYK